MAKDFYETFDKYDFNQTANFPKAEIGQTYRTLRTFSVFFALFLVLIRYLLQRFLGVDVPLLPKIALAIVVIGFALYAINIFKRWQYFEREPQKNDKRAIRLRKAILENVDLDSQFEDLYKKESDKITEKDKMTKEAISLFNNLVVLVNTRQTKANRVQRTWTVIVRRPKGKGGDTTNEILKREIIVSNKDERGQARLNRVAKQAVYDNEDGLQLNFGELNQLPNGDHYIEAIEDLGVDPWFYEQKLSELRAKKETSTMQHSVPYRPAVFRGMEFKGFVNYDEANKAKRAKAIKWLDENIPDIQRIFADNDITAKYNENLTEFRQSSAELFFALPPTHKRGDGKRLMSIAEYIDDYLNVKGSSMRPVSTPVNGIKLSLALPNGKDKFGNELLDRNNEIMDYTTTLNLEDVMRELYG